MGAEDRLSDRGLSGVHLGEERLQASLSQVPLAHTEAHSLAVEVARETGEAVRRGGPGFEGPREGEAAIVERLRGDGGRCDVAAREQRGPRLRANLAVDNEIVGLLKRAHRGLGAAAEVRVDPATIEAELLQPRLDARDLRALRVKLVGRHCASAGCIESSMSQRVGEAGMDRRD